MYSNLDTVLSPKKASTTRENYQGQHALCSLHITLNSVEIIMDPHSHAGVLSQSADAQNSPPQYYAIIFRY